MFFTPANPAGANHNLQSQIARDFNNSKGIDMIFSNSLLRVSTGPTAIPISVNRNAIVERVGQSTLRSTQVAPPLVPQMTQRIIRRSPSEGTHAFGLEALKRSLHQQRESSGDIDTVSITNELPRTSSHRYVSTSSLTGSGIRQGPSTPNRGLSTQVLSTTSVRSPSATVQLNPDMKASTSSRISHETQTVHMHEPRIVGVNRKAAIEKSVKHLEPVLIEVRRAENVTTTESVNIKNMLVDCYKRIVLMGMENDRLNQKVAEYEHIVAELRARITSIEIEFSDSETYKAEYTRYKSRSDTLELKISELLTERNSFLAEIESLRSDHSLRSELEKIRSLYSESQNQISMLASENDRLHKIKNELQAQSQKEIAELKRQISMLAAENERLQESRSQVLKLEKDITSYRNEITLLVSENERLHSIKNELLHYQNELRESQNRVSLQAVELERLRAENKSLLSEVSQLKLQLASRTADSEQLFVLKSDNQKLSSELLEFRNKLALLAAENERLHSELSNLRDKLARTERDYSQLYPLNLLTLLQSIPILSAAESISARCSRSSARLSGSSTPAHPATCSTPTPRIEFDSPAPASLGLVHVVCHPAA